MRHLLEDDEYKELLSKVKEADDLKKLNADFLKNKDRIIDLTLEYFGEDCIHDPKSNTYYCDDCPINGGDSHDYLFNCDRHTDYSE